MRSSSEIIRNLRMCVGPDHNACDTCVHLDPCGDCADLLMQEACQALEGMSARCARYAEEIMVLQEQLRGARHE